MDEKEECEFAVDTIAVKKIIGNVTGKKKCSLTKRRGQKDEDKMKFVSVNVPPRLYSKDEKKVLITTKVCALNLHTWSEINPRIAVETNFIHAILYQKKLMFSLPKIMRLDTASQVARIYHWIEFYLNGIHVASTDKFVCFSKLKE